MKNLTTFLALLLFPVYITSQNINLQKELNLVEDYLTQMESVNLEVSDAPVKWHLLHILQVIDGVYLNAKNSNPDDYKSKSNFKWFYLSTFGKIPRGTIKSPDNVNPSYKISKQDIIEKLLSVRTNLKNYDALHKNNFYKHHILLDLNKRKIKRFFKVHTKHHLKIVEDIIKKESQKS